MNTIKRYEPSSHYSADDGMKESPAGNWVSYDDYKAIENSLIQEVSLREACRIGLKMYQDRIESGQTNKDSKEFISSLQSRIQRLQEAGDTMADLISLSCKTDGSYKDLSTKQAFAVSEWRSVRFFAPQK